MSVIRISPLVDGWSKVSFEYDPDVIDIIKSFPSSMRRWRPDTKTWKVDTYVAGELSVLLQQHGYTVIEPGRRSSPPPPRRAPRGDNWADLLMDAVGPERIEPVHRALTRVLHPDAGTGDTILMQQLNVARDRRAVA